MKKYSLVLLDFAKQDAKEINRWYKSIRKELAKRFTSDLKNTLFSIERLPTAYAIRYEKVRFANLDIFPYLIEFFINEARLMPDRGDYF